jgi:hypothetical protein
MKIVTPQWHVTLGAAIDRSAFHRPTADRRDFHGTTEPLVSSRKSLRSWPRYRVPTRRAVTSVSDLGSRTRAELQSDERVRRPAGARRAAPAMNSIDPPAAGPGAHVCAAGVQTTNSRQIRTGGRSDDQHWPFGLATQSRALRGRSRGQTRLGDRASLAMHDRPARSCWRVRGDARPTMRVWRCSRRSTACDTACESEVRDA